MPKVKKWRGLKNETGVHFKCPGCKHYHMLPVANDGEHPRWDFNGDFDKPTLRPSILARSGHYVKGENQKDCFNCKENAANPADAEGMECMICHSFVTDGNIQFLGDCTHALAGQTVPLPEIEGIDDGPT